MDASILTPSIKCAKWNWAYYVEYIIWNRVCLWRVHNETQTTHRADEIKLCMLRKYMWSENVEGFWCCFILLVAMCRTPPDVRTSARLEKAESESVSAIGLILTDIRHPNHWMSLSVPVSMSVSLAVSGPWACPCLCLCVCVYVRVRTHVRISVLDIFVFVQYEQRHDHERGLGHSHWQRNQIRKWT